MSKGKIWLVNYYSTPPMYVSNPRYIEFADNLMDEGYDVTIVSASYLKTKNIDLITQSENYQFITYGKFQFLHIKVKPYDGNGLSRMYSIWQFAYKLYLFRHHFPTPDIIIHNIHAPFDYLISSFARKIKCKYIVEAWDLWPDSFVRFGLISAKNPLVKFAYQIERKLYEKADKIIFTFPGGIDYLKEMEWTLEMGGKINTAKIHYINNGVNLKKFNENATLYPKNDSDLNSDKLKKVVYLGSIRLVNNVKLLIDAAELLIGEKIVFLIYGDGSDREFLESYCIERNITNVKFKTKWMAFNEVPYILSKSDINILNYQEGFGKYGSSSGKLFLYLASGKPICSNVDMKYCLVTEHNLGISKEFKNSTEYAHAIKQLLDLSNNDYNSMCLRVQKTAELFDYQNLSNQLIHVIED
jgi:glycosyltransferase involved in cell wall biosynthesis